MAIFNQTGVEVIELTADELALDAASSCLHAIQTFYLLGLATEEELKASENLFNSIKARVEGESV